MAGYPLISNSTGWKPVNDVKPFFDTNVLLYLMSADSAKADRVEELVACGGTISVQVLNEFVAVTSRKLALPWAEIRAVLAPIRTVCGVVPISLETHDRGLDLAERHGFSIYDAMIVASALLAGCRTLYTEDLNDGQRIDRQLIIRNPFSAV